VAREECAALLGPEDVLWGDQVHGAQDDYRYVATVVPFKGGPHAHEYGPTLAAAYLALRDALAAREP
jgi:hypothetical protein